jgi:hypothetical protein
MLTAVHSYATDQAKRHAIPLDLVRFTRRQLREHLAAAGAGWGDTQLKVHLARLADLELVVAHRLESGSYGYELTWNPPASRSATHSYDEDGRFLAGLTDPATLLDDRADSTYDAQPVGANTPLVGPWSAPGRGVVGPRSDTVSDGENAADLLDWASGDG